jgi:hypothetical protein
MEVDAERRWHRDECKMEGELQCWPWHKRETPCACACASRELGIGRVLVPVLLEVKA